MKTKSLSSCRVTALLACSFTVGCVTTKRIPANWEPAIARGTAAVQDISGLYANGSRPRLDVFFWDEPLSPAPQFVRFRYVAKARLEATALRDGIPPEVKVVDVIVDKKTGGVATPSTSHVDAGKEGVQLHVRGAEFFKGSDGRLYGHVAEGGVAAFAWVIPVVGEGRSWHRWAPAESR
jgi:hypothetical protein